MRNILLGRWYRYGMGVRRDEVKRDELKGATARIFE
jgi:hypothetical protein